MKKTLLIMCAIILCACEFNTTRSNRESDRDDAIEVSDKLFNCLEYDDYDSAIKLFSEESFSVTPKDSLKEIFKISKEALGDFKVRVLQEWKTEIVEGTQAASNYALLYDCEYTKNHARVILSMGKTDGEIKIMGYRLVSPAFDK